MIAPEIYDTLSPREQLRYQARLKRDRLLEQGAIFWSSVRRYNGGRAIFEGVNLKKPLSGPRARRRPRCHD